jgi:DNA-binding MarR family transcriptional regulator
MSGLDEQVVLDAEAVTHAPGAAHKAELKLWLRLLTCTNLIEGEIRRRLRERFDTTLPRFDLMAQLDRAEEGMTLNEVSRRMMVSNGNVTGLAERLAEEGLVDRRTAEHDRRAQVIRLTPKGRRAFRRMAAEHENWIAEMVRGLDEHDIEALMTLLAMTKSSVRRAIEGGE